MHAPPAIDYHQCTPLLVTTAVTAVLGVIGWALWRPKSIVGQRDGRDIYGLTLEWPVAFSAAMVLSCIQVLLAHKVGYLSVLGVNKDAFQEFGAFLFVTPGALAFSSVRSNRALRILCLTAASIGVCIICSTIGC